MSPVVTREEPTSALEKLLLLHKWSLPWLEGEGSRGEGFGGLASPGSPLPFPSRRQRECYRLISTHIALQVAGEGGAAFHSQ